MLLPEKGFVDFFAPSLQEKCEIEGEHIGEWIIETLLREQRMNKRG